MYITVPIKVHQYFQMYIKVHQYIQMYIIVHQYIQLYVKVNQYFQMYIREHQFIQLSIIAVDQYIQVIPVYPVVVSIPKRLINLSTSNSSVPQKIYVRVPREINQ